MCLAEAEKPRDCTRLAGKMSIYARYGDVFARHIPPPRIFVELKYPNSLLTAPAPPGGSHNCHKIIAIADSLKNQFRRPFSAQVRGNCKRCAEPSQSLVQQSYRLIRRCNVRNRAKRTDNAVTIEPDIYASIFCAFHRILAGKRPALA